MNNGNGQHIVFVDDEPNVRQVIGETLEQVGFKVSCFASAADCRQNLSSQECDLLKRSIRTIEAHRARVMGKLGADSLVDLVKRTIMDTWSDRSSSSFEQGLSSKIRIFRNRQASGEGVEFSVVEVSCEESLCLNCGLQDSMLPHV